MTGKQRFEMNGRKIILQVLCFVIIDFPVLN